MKSLLAIALLALNASAFPIPKAAQRSVAGTTWKGPIQWSGHQHLDQILIFEPGGKAVMRYAQGPNNDYVGTWKQEGAKITFELAGCSWYEATITGDLLTGTARNDRQMTATHSAKREANP